MGLLVGLRVPRSAPRFEVIAHPISAGPVVATPPAYGRHSAMAVTIAGNGEAIEPNHVYVCPSGSTLKEGRLVLSPLGSAPVPNLVDALLYSLAEDRGEQAIGVVLSGGGSDGTVGIGAIKEAGGFTLVQGPHSPGPGLSFSSRPMCLLAQSGHGAMSGLSPL